jgi:hypothetical protein
LTPTPAPHHDDRMPPRHRRPPPPPTVRQILAWTDTYHERSGRWPSRRSGEIPGTRGLPGGSSLKERG